MGLQLIPQPQLVGNYPLLSVAHTTPQAFSQNITAQLQFNGVDNDTFGWWNGSTFNYVPKWSGWYLVTVNLTVLIQNAASTTINSILSITRTGANYLQQTDARLLQAATNTFVNISLTTMIPIPGAGDSIGATFDCNAGNGITVQIGSTMTIAFLHT